MPRTVRFHKYWLVPVCLLLAGMVFLTGYQYVNAQTPGAPGAMPGAASPATPAAGAAVSSEPTMGFSAVVPAGAKSFTVKNWDGHVTGFVRFKYKTLDNSIITVHLPATYTAKTQMMTKAAWDTLFRCYGMDIEAEIALKEDRFTQVAGEAMSKILEQVQKQTGNGQDSGVNPVTAALDFAKTSLPSLGSAGDLLPPLMPF